ncbi:MAG: cation:proton antiporter [Vicinamibacterales bacterium]
MPQGLVGDLLIVYAVALGIIVLAGRLGVPPIVALIGAGALSGPSGLQIIQTPEEVDQLAEIGIVLLLFTVGLEFPMRELQRIWRPVVLGGVLQVAGTAALAGAIASAAGVSPRAAVFIGLFLALSSTAIVLKELARHNWLDSPSGRITTGVLLFQDLAVVLLLLAAPILAGAVDTSAVPGILGRAVLAVAGILAVGWLVLPALFRLVMACGQREAFPLAVLVASVGTAVFGASLGVSMALGAFLAGLVLAGSEFSHQAHTEVRPLRDLLTSLFFISLGMLLDAPAFARNLPLIAVITVAAVLLKSVAAGAALAVSGTPGRVTAIAAISLAQVGEFSFVLGRDAVALGVLPANLWQILLPASILTMLAAPTMVSIAPRLADRLRIGTTTAGATMATAGEGYVLILGFGVGGRLVASALRELGIPYHVIDINGATVREARAAGEPITYGDVTAADTLIASGVERARAVVVVLSDPDASMKVVGTVTRFAPATAVIVRARYRAEAVRLQKAGAIAVAEELEASLEVVAQALAGLDVPGNIIQVLVEDYRRRQGMPVLRTPAPPRVPLSNLAPDVLAAPVATHQLQEGDWATGRTLAELNLRATTGVSVLAVRREGRSWTSPPSDLPLAPNDVLYLLGDEAAVLLARARLSLGDA